MARTRRRIAEGIYADAYGLAAVVKARGIQRERRWPLGTDLNVLRRWREQARVELTRTAPPVGRRRTLAGDAAVYLRSQAHLASYKARSVEVRAWVSRLGTSLRTAITRDDVLRTRVAWLEAGTSPKTINNRVQTLRHLYRTLDGRQAPTPCDEVAPLPVHKTPPVVIPASLITAIDARITSPKARARFRVYASTGKRPSEIMRAQPEDVDLERRVWVVRDGKGGYSPGLYLNDDMLAAWQLFVASEAWGTFCTNSFARMLKTHGWPKGVKPYNLRHTTWITASERGADLSDVQAGAGHRSISTTRRHYVPVLDSRMQRLSTLIDGRFGWTTVPASVPAEDCTPVDKPAPNRTMPARNVARETTANVTKTAKNLRRK